jgi:hypothetical protein
MPPHVALYGMSLRFSRVAPHNYVEDRDAGSNQCSDAFA